ncbi:MAG: UDP-N-acetylmuramate--L-alanine ligase [Acidimicrobiales bacterium]
MPRRVHVVGAGGAGMSAIAEVLATMGHTVTGSDHAGSATLEHLRRLGIDVVVGHDASHVDGVDLVACSTAIPATNTEVRAAHVAGVPVLRRAEALAAICDARRTVAVSGTHGKTTTTAMLALALRAAGMEPSFIVGGEVRGLGSGASWGSGGWFVVEADESDGTFVELGAEAVIVTNIEADHLDHWGSYAALQAGFRRFLAEATGPRVLCADDPMAVQVAEGLECLTYGTSEAATHRMVDVVAGADGVGFDLEHAGQRLGRVEVALPGLHNARNAAAAVVTALALGAELGPVATALSEFPGVRRRWERRGEAAGVTFVDSYDHLPTEVSAALDAAAAGRWERIVCVFQPHRHTRTRDLWRDFAHAFEGADVLCVTDIYAAGQEPIPGVTGKLVVDAVLDAHPWRRVAWLPRRSDVLAYLAAELRPGDLCLTLGAGDLTTLPDELVTVLGARAAASA